MVASLVPPALPYHSAYKECDVIPVCHLPRAWLLLALLGALLGACSSPATQPSTSSGAVAPAEPSPRNITLAMIIRDEPGALTPKLRVGTTLADAKRLFNAGLAINDELQSPRPYLAESLPQLNTDSWRVGPDGR